MNVKEYDLAIFHDFEIGRDDLEIGCFYQN